MASGVYKKYVEIFVRSVQVSRHLSPLTSFPGKTPGKCCAQDGSTPSDRRSILLLQKLHQPADGALTITRKATPPLVIVALPPGTVGLPLRLPQDGRPIESLGTRRGSPDRPRGPDVHFVVVVNPALTTARGLPRLQLAPLPRQNVHQPAFGASQLRSLVEILNRIAYSSRCSSKLDPRLPLAPRQNLDHPRLSLAHSRSPAKISTTLAFRSLPRPSSPSARNVRPRSHSSLPSPSARSPRSLATTRTARGLDSWNSPRGNLAPATLDAFKPRCRRGALLSEFHERGGHGDAIVFSTLHDPSKLPS
ncbi:hypothetical protein C8R47DRAFT_1212573 [Mycena vitilis]|nr:hypothetical protein C8R47DRAFT_1212573 [Mycena vitilis]